MPNRILREGVNSSPRVNALTPGAEIMYRRLMSVADDYGRYYGTPATIRGACWPTKLIPPCEQDVSNWIAECSQGDRPLLAIYSVDGCLYVQLNDFNQQTRSKSKFPDPAIGLPVSCSQIDSNCVSLVGGVVRISETETETETETVKSISPPTVEAGSVPPFPWDREQQKAYLTEIGWKGVRKATPAQLEQISGLRLRDMTEDTDLKSLYMTALRLDWFDEFWSVYWRKVDKSGARVAYFEHVTHFTISDRIMEAVQEQAAAMAKREEERRPHAATWLNHSRWDDQAAGSTDSGENGFPLIS